MGDVINVTKRIELDYGHTLPNHYSFCNQIHGHRGIIEATVQGDVVAMAGSSSQGMVLDFSILKQLLMTKVHALLDHGFAVWKESKTDLAYIKTRNDKYIITETPPTAECLAKWAYDQIEMDIIHYNLKLVRVRWYETPSSWADYPAISMEDK